MSPLSKDGSSIDTRQINAQGGVLSYINDIFRPSTYAKSIINFHQFKQGVFSSSGGGWVRDNATTLNSGAAGLDFGTYIDSAGTISLLAQFGSVLYKYTPSTQPYPTTGVQGTGAGTSLLTGLNTTAIPCMRNFAPSIATTSPITVYCNGAAEPTKITSTTTTSALLFNTPGVWPGTFNSKQYTKPKFCCVFGQRMVYAGFATTGSSGNAVAYDLLISADSNAESFVMSTPAAATDAVAFTIPGILGLPTAITSFKINNNVSTEVLIVGCQRGVCIISGTDATSYGLQILTQSYGIPSNRCFIQLDSALIYLATDGIRTYTGEQNNPNLLTESLTLGIYDQILLFDNANLSKAHATHHKNSQELLFWIPYVGDNGVPAHCIIMNYNSVSGNPIWYFKQNTTVNASIEFNHQMYGMTANGYVQNHYNGNLYDGGNANIVPGAQIILSLISVGNPAQSCSIRQACTITDGAAQKTKTNADAILKMDDGRTIKLRQNPVDYILSSPTNPATALGTWTIGLSGFPGDNPQLLDEFAPIGQARFWEFSYLCDDSSMNLDFAALSATISIGGMRT